MVFHSPQDSQRPLHLDVTAPHDWQTKRFSGRAMSVQLALGEAPAVAVQPARFVDVVGIAAQAAQRLLARRIAERPAQGGLAFGRARADAGIEADPADRA